MDSRLEGTNVRYDAVNEGHLGTTATPFIFPFVFVMCVWNVPKSHCSLDIDD